MIEEKTKLRSFETGAIRDSDEDKESYIESISWLALRRYAFYMKTQEKKYGRGNWKKGIPTESGEDSLFRHLTKYLLNKYDNANIEPDIDHLAAALFNLQIIIENEEKSKLIKKNE